jgi:uncharacterized protein
MNLSGYPCSTLSKKLEGRARGDGERGIFAREPIRRGDLLAVWGGKTMSYEELVLLPYDIRKLSIQVDEDIYLVSAIEGEGDWVNHSCEPNAGIRGQISLVAMRDITPGEEVTFDYAMSDSTNYDEFECSCGAPTCRGYVGGRDWQLPELQKRYRGFFSSYLERRLSK